MSCANLELEFSDESKIKLRHLDTSEKNRYDEQDRRASLSSTKGNTPVAEMQIFAPSGELQRTYMLRRSAVRHLREFLKVVG